VGEGGGVRCRGFVRVCGCGGHDAAGAFGIWKVGGGGKGLGGCAVSGGSGWWAVAGGAVGLVGVEVDVCGVFSGGG
jgi:hypothetical protein